MFSQLEASESKLLGTAGGGQNEPEGIKTSKVKQRRGARPDHRRATHPTNQMNRRARNLQSRTRDTGGAVSCLGDSPRRSRR